MTERTDVNGGPPASRDVPEHPLTRHANPEHRRPRMGYPARGFPGGATSSRRARRRAHSPLLRTRRGWRARQKGAVFRDGRRRGARSWWVARSTVRAKRSASCARRVPPFTGQGSTQCSSRGGRTRGCPAPSAVSRQGWITRPAATWHVAPCARGLSLAASISVAMAARVKEAAMRVEEVGELTRVGEEPRPEAGTAALEHEAHEPSARLQAAQRAPEHVQRGAESAAPGVSSIRAAGPAGPRTASSPVTVQAPRSRTRVGSRAAPSAPGVGVIRSSGAAEPASTR